MSKKRIIITISIIILAVIFIAIASLFINRELSFTEVYKKQFDYDPSRRDLWYTIIDGKPESEFVECDIESIGIDSSVFDFEKYNYIISFNHEIKRINYNYYKTNQRNAMFIPTSLIGNATLDKDVTDYVHVYRFDKINLSSDWHNLYDNFE